MADQRRRTTFWVTQQATLILASGATGQSGQQSQDLGGDVRTKAGTTMIGLTLVRTFVTGFWAWDAAAASTPIWASYTLAVLKASQHMDDGDFADIGDHDGDLQLHDVRFLREALVANTTLFPGGEHKAGAGIYAESRSQRKMDRIDDTIWIVVQKSVATEQAVTLRVNVSQLWKARS